MGLIRSVLRKIFMNVQDEHDPSRILALNKVLSEELVDALKKSGKEWEPIKKNEKESEGGATNFRFMGQIDCVIPSNGFTVNTVQRLLLSYGGIKCLKAVPMAMFIKYKE